MPNSGGWNDWLTRLTGYQKPSNPKVALGANATPQQIAQYYMGDVLKETGGANALSPQYQNYLKNNALEPYLARYLMAGAQYDQLPKDDAADYAPFLQSWLGTPNRSSVQSPIGDLPSQLRTLMGKLQQGQADIGAGQNTPMAEMTRFYNDSPNILAGIMGMTQGIGPVANYYRQKIQDTLDEFYRRRARPDQYSNSSWLEPFLAALPR